MSTSTTPALPQELSAVWPIKRWTTAEFDELVRSGFLREGSRTFLWNGEIIEPLSENQPHRNAVANLLRLLIKLLPETEWTVDQNGPLALRDGYKPQPDLVVLKGPRSRYVKRVPVPDDVALLVEVSDSTYPDDTGGFLREYAATGIERYWVVNILKRMVEVYSGPCVSGGKVPGYAIRETYGLEDPISLTVANPFEDDPNRVPTEVMGEFTVRDILRNSLEAEPH